MILPPARFRKHSIALYFVTLKTIQRLNKRFFGHDRPTDVISFGDAGDKYAEIFIAPEVVRENARECLVGYEEELCRCAIHGILHIFGYRDTTKRAKARMWKKQEATVKKVMAP